MGYTKEKRLDNLYKRLAKEVLKEVDMEEKKKFNCGSLEIRIGTEIGIQKFIQKLKDESI